MPNEKADNLIKIKYESNKSIEDILLMGQAQDECKKKIAKKMMPVCACVLVRDKQEGLYNLVNSDKYFLLINQNVFLIEMNVTC